MEMESENKKPVSTIRYIFLLILFAGIRLQAFSQSPIYSFTFTDSISTSQQWTLIDFDAIPGEWKWKANGKADQGIYWNNRSRIQSNSEGGAIVMDADDYVSNGAGGAIEAGIQIDSLDFSADATVYLKFNQYYREFIGSTRVDVSSNGGLNWSSFVLNPLVQKNVETGPDDVQIIDITAVAALSSNVSVRFVFEGNYYFWILDDIQFWASYPFPETEPKYVGDSLASWSYPYEVDSSRWAYVPNELVVQFAPNVSEPEKQALRDTFGATKIDSCVCDRLELWELNGMIIVGGDTLSPFGGTIDIDGIVKSAKTKSKVDGVDRNRYNYNELLDTTDVPNPAITAVPSGIQQTPDLAVRVAILDTGVDYDHADLISFIHRSSEVLADGLDNDQNCLVDDPIGWNFIDDNNNPDDDHGHGTHVAGIVTKQLGAYAGPDCAFRLIPYKTHDFHGVSNLFDVTCGTYQAIQDDAEVINDSWGFYGDSSSILRNAIDTAAFHEVLIVSAAGNDTLDLADRAQYPACYNVQNSITVGAYDTIDINAFMIAPFSNFAPGCVEILAPGSAITSTLPNDSSGKKSGTSMATPAVSAAAAIAYCAMGKDYAKVRSCLLNNALKLPGQVGNEVQDGNILSWDIPCFTVAIKNQDNISLGKVFPNPMADYVYFQPTTHMTEGELILSDVFGKVILFKKISVLEEGDLQKLDMSGFQPGIYFLSIKKDQYIEGKTLIKVPPK